MDKTNFHHLRLFWTVAREGSIRAASDRLHLSQPSISSQIRALEDALGEALFDRRGRGLVLTSTGELVRRYAEEIFLLGDDMVAAVRQASSGGPSVVRVGVCQWLPKLLVGELMRPLLAMQMTIETVEDAMSALRGDLAAQRLDMVISDAPSTDPTAARIFNHLLGSSGIVACASPALARKVKPGFPGSLNGSPVLLPPRESQICRHVERWLADSDLRPRVRGAFDDSAMMKEIAALGHGWIPVHEAFADKVCRRYRLVPLGAIGALRDQFYLITTERKMRQPAALAVASAGRAAMGG